MSDTGIKENEVVRVAFMPLSVEQMAREILPSSSVNKTRCHPQAGLGLTNVTMLPASPDITTTTPGKRKWLPARDDNNDALHTARLEVDHGHSISLRTSLTRSKQDPCSKKRLVESRDSGVQPALASFTPRGENGAFLDNEDRSRPSYPHVPFDSQHYRVIKSNATSCLDHDLQLISVEQDVLPLPKMNKATRSRQIGGLAVGRDTHHLRPAEILPVHDGEVHRPLSELKWPFGDLISAHETLRGGGGGEGTKPQTTGSSGFPQFVTSGPEFSLSLNNLFGYDRDDIWEGISWA